MGAETLFAGIEQAERQQPLVQGDFTVLEDRADRHSEGFGALVALVNAGAGGLACQLRDAVQGATARADRAMRPVQGFKVFAGLVGIAIDRIGDIHG